MRTFDSCERREFGGQRQRDHIDRMLSADFAVDHIPLKQSRSSKSRSSKPGFVFRPLRSLQAIHKARHLTDKYPSPGSGQRLSQCSQIRFIVIEVWGDAQVSVPCRHYDAALTEFPRQ